MKFYQKAIFFDRDGTLIKNIDLLINPRQFKILRGAARAIKIFNTIGYKVIVITNQPVISRGLIGVKGMEKLHKNLVKKFRKEGAIIDAIYFCPHHPDSKIARWKMKCKCRKPEPGMILKAIKDFNIDPRKSIMIGDALIDVLSGKRAGIKTTILVKTGPGHPRLDKVYHRTKPDYIVKDLRNASSIVKKLTA